MGLIAGACCAALLACASSKRNVSSPVAQSDAGSPGVIPAPPEHDEITRLEAQIDAELVRRQLPPAPPPSCSGASCSDASATVQSMGTFPRVDNDPSCKAPVNDTCKDSCTMSDSICKNAERICTIAKQLDNDAWANEKCVKGSESCTQSKKLCCSCL
ncbi:MAG: hypothetical protein ABI175_14490 [Polyangiales bacterium]